MEQYPFEYLSRAQRVDNFTRLVEQAENGEAFTITKDDKPVAVVVGYSEWLSLNLARAVVAGV